MLMFSSPLTGITLLTKPVTVFTVTTCLENPANFREFDSCQGNVREKSCQGKLFIANVLIGTTLVFKKVHTFGSACYSCDIHESILIILNSQKMYRRTDTGVTGR